MGKQIHPAECMSLFDALNYFSRKKHCPIQLSSDMPDDWHKHIQCKPISNEWKHNMENAVWSTQYKGSANMTKKQKLLQQLLLSFGGEEVCQPDIEEDMDNILSYGQLWNGWTSLIRMKGEPSRCHSNSAELFLANKNNEKVLLTIATGYALSPDGMWRQHSWLVQRLSRSIRIIETTEKRLLYFGFAMTDDVLNDFIYYNT